ncbi:MAG: hypothetical protein ACP5D7_15840 [Limnospira sp.]
MATDRPPKSLHYLKLAIEVDNRGLFPVDLSSPPPTGEAAAMPPPYLGLT